MGVTTFWSYVILLLPVIVAVALILVSWVSKHLAVLSERQTGWFEPQWLMRIGRPELDCVHPALEALAGCVGERGRNCVG